MAALDEDDRVVTCTIVRGEVLFGIGKLPAGRRRTELEQTGFGFWRLCVANRCRSGRAIFALLLNLPGSNAASPWMSATATLATGVALRYKLDGQELERVGVTYVLQKADAGWKIAVLIIHDTDEVAGHE